MGFVLMAGGGQEQACSVEEAAFGIEKGRPDRGVEGIHQISQFERAGAGAFGEPAGFVELAQDHRLAPLTGFERVQMAGKFAQQVAARYPGRQAQSLLSRWLVDSHRDAKQMGLRPVQFNAVGNHPKLFRNGPCN